MYQNPHSAGYEVFSKTAMYSAASHGDLSATASYLITNDVPDYAGMFYHPTEHEVISTIKYGQIDPGYDSELREFQESLQGVPLEFYIPSPISVADGIGKSENSIELKNPFKEISERMNRGIINEIKKAQDEVRGKELIIRDIQVEETLVLRRKLRIREIILRKEKDI